jgi:hypothetical protein
VAASGLSRLTWYQATRHTFASQRVSGGGSIEKLKEFMGRWLQYVMPLFRSRVFEMLDVDLMAEVGPFQHAAGTGVVGLAIVAGCFYGEREAARRKDWMSPGSSVGRAED